MIYDCFIFSNELELLNIRLEYLYDQVDFFVLVEADRTLSGIKKPLTFKENADKFSKYADKIIYVQADAKPELTDWDYEWFQRNAIKEGLENCKDNDIIFISDVDEIINIKGILKMDKVEAPALIEVPMYYYFFNVKLEDPFQFNLVSKYKDIKNIHIGNRMLYRNFALRVIKPIGYNTGWHFSFLFGFDISRYINKIESFSHQEFNTAFYKDPKRIYNNLLIHRDIFNRSFVILKRCDPSEYAEISPIFTKLGLEKYRFRMTPRIFFQLSYLRLPQQSKYGFVLSKKNTQMIGTILWRLLEARDVLLGKRKTVIEIKSKDRKVLSINNSQEYNIENQTIKAFLNSISIEFLFCEFGENRVNAGGSEFNLKNRLEPSLSTIKQFFPKAKFTVYSDFDLKIDGVELIKAESPVPEKDNPRYLYRTADYFKFKSLLESEADFRCVVDTDMFAVSPELYSLVYLTKTFGFCAPYNPRNLLKRDMEISFDARPILDESNGFGHSYNQSPMTLWKDSEKGKLFFQKCCDYMIKEPSRASLVMWKAAKETGASPYLLPAEFCVCGDDVGIGNEVLLHVGHAKVANYYNVKLEN